MPGTRIETLPQLAALQHDLQRARSRWTRTVLICGGTGCRAAGSAELGPVFEREIANAGLGEQVNVRYTGCHGFCERGALVVIAPERVWYQGVRLEDVSEIVSETLLHDRPVDRLLYREPMTGETKVLERDVGFYARQMRVALRYNGEVDPADIEDYLSLGGYGALAHVFEAMTPEQVIEEIKRSGLRGRGGGGFPTGRKWETCRDAQGHLKYVVCNGDEGDPGAFMDRSILEGNPHGVLEGMLIGSYAIGASQGFVYVRYEYPLALENTARAMDQAREYGLLGDNILGSGHSFDVEIVRGGGAFVCGESTALMASIEGGVGEPRSKYVHTVESGLWERPTNLNNVETWANVPVIIERGADWFASVGTESSKGTKVFSVVGKVKNTGLVEVPMGMTLHELVYDVCGGVAGDRELKAIQTGGPSGGCIPAELLHLPIDYEHLTEAGSMMGSGGMIVMDDRTCMVELARYFTSFLADESCGKCTPCREGLHQMLQVLNGITQGRGKDGDIELLEDLAELLTWGALCGLGTTAANPVLSTLRYFRPEYDAHIHEKKCPAGVCRELVTYRVDPEACTGCHLCARNCPEDAIKGEPKKPHEILTDRCVKCGICFGVCKFDAVIVE